MDASSLKRALRDAPLNAWRYHPSIGSTNDEALAWAAQGAPDWSLVVADQQTRGRGRAGRRWHTPPGSALALSFVLRPTAQESEHFSHFSGLAAVALRAALAPLGYPLRIKWPNDLLLAEKKAAGILVEASWSGGQAEAVVIGIGVNVRRTALPSPEALSFPAVSLEQAAPPPPREQLIRAIVEALFAWRPRLGSPALLETWQEALAWRGQCVQVGAHRGRLLGLSPEGRLRLKTADGLLTLAQTEGHLRPCKI